MFEHQYLVGSGQRNRSARSAFPDNAGDHRHAQLQAFFGRAGNRLGLPAFFCLHSGKGTRRIDERNDGKAKTIGQFHKADRFAIAFGLTHAEIMAKAAFGIIALFMPDQHHAPVAHASQPT